MPPLQRRFLQPGERIRVLVVDDSVVIRRLVTHALEEDPLLEVVGTAANGSIALQRIPQLHPDVLTLDIEMPEMDGLELLRRIRGTYPALRAIMFSTLTERGAAITLEALSLGADDYVPKVSNEGSLDRSLLRLREQLIPKIRQFFLLPASPRPAGTTGDRPVAPVLVAPPTGLRARSTLLPRAVLIGVSTGGPAALGAILPGLPADFPVPVLIVQHMPPLFTRLLAERLNALCAMQVVEAKNGEPVGAGKIFIAPGDFHMKVVAGVRGECILLDQGAPQNSCRPAADVLFSAAAETYGGAVVAAVLTGMGQDSLCGARLLRAKGATVLAQDEASSVVWGMPGSIIAAGLADAVLPLNRIVPEIVRLAASRG